MLGRLKASSVNPAPGDFAQMNAAARAAAKRRVLVVVDGDVALTASQRAEIAQVAKAGDMQVAVVLSSPIARGAHGRARSA